MAHIFIDPDSNTARHLESLIDANGLAAVLDCIGEICRLKADHIRETWQDRALARQWDRVAKRLDTMQEWAGREGF